MAHYPYCKTCGTPSNGVMFCDECYPEGGWLEEQLEEIEELEELKQHVEELKEENGKLRDALGKAAVYLYVHGQIGLIQD